MNNTKTSETEFGTSGPNLSEMTEDELFDHFSGDIICIIPIEET